MVVKSVQALEPNRQVHHDECSDGPQVEGVKIYSSSPPEIMLPGTFLTASWDVDWWK